MQEKQKGFLSPRIELLIVVPILLKKKAEKWYMISPQQTKSFNLASWINNPNDMQHYRTHGIVVELYFSFDSINFFAAIPLYNKIFNYNQNAPIESVYTVLKGVEICL